MLTSQTNPYSDRKKTGGCLGPDGEGETECKDAHIASSCSDENVLALTGVLVTWMHTELYS